MAKFYGIIPAREGSKGVKNKNIRNLGGVPLLKWTIEAARNSNLDNVILNSDSQEYLDAFKDVGVVPYLRNPKLGGDRVLTSDVILDLIHEMDLKDDDFIILLQPTCPFRTADLINQSINLLERQEECAVMSLVSCEANHPLRMKRVICGEAVNYIETGVEDMRPRQELPDVYIRSGSIYGCAVHNFIKHGTFGGLKTLSILEDEDSHVNVDCERDFLVAESLLKLNPRLFSIVNS